MKAPCIRNRPCSARRIDYSGWVSSKVSAWKHRKWLEPRTRWTCRLSSWKGIPDRFCSLPVTPDEEGALFGIEFEQKNLFGTGKDLAFKFNNSDTARIASVSYTNPYHTMDGVSRTISASVGEFDSREVDTAEYILDSSTLGVRYRVPVTETNSIHYGFSFERLELEKTTETPPEFVAVIDKTPKADNGLFTVGFSRDTRDEFFFPTRGTSSSISLESTFPGSDFEYYKLNLEGLLVFSGFSGVDPERICRNRLR